ncbi:hypothetical protein BHM03_00040450 [Ensete ventricosum]|nr:hypothetical protein BHM03_00040450 [Ensete ventricosum]
MLRVSCTMQKKGKKEKEKNAALTQEAHAGKETRGSLAARHAPRKSQNWAANRPSIEEIRVSGLVSASCPEPKEPRRPGVRSSLQLPQALDSPESLQRT